MWGCDVNKPVVSCNFVTKKTGSGAHENYIRPAYTGIQFWKVESPSYSSMKIIPNISENYLENQEKSHIMQLKT